MWWGFLLMLSIKVIYSKILSQYPVPHILHYFCLRSWPPSTSFFSNTALKFTTLSITVYNAVTFLMSSYYHFDHFYLQVSSHDNDTPSSSATVLLPQSEFLVGYNSSETWHRLIVQIMNKSEKWSFWFHLFLIYLCLSSLKQILRRLLNGLQK